MEKGPIEQLDLFSQAASPAAKTLGERKKFFTFIHAYEKKIILAISIAVVGIICFSLGVEKGKRIAETKSAEPLQQIKAEPVKSLAPVTPQAKQFEPLPIVNTAEPRTGARAAIVTPAVEAPGSYTIQLATYKNQVSAQKEAGVLRKKGFSTQIISRGGYSILCVGRFPDKKTAQSLLSQLARKYQGCYLRRL